MKKMVWLCLCLCSLAIPASAQSLWEDSDWSLTSQWEGVADVHTEKIRKSELVLKPRLEVPFGEVSQFTTLLRFRGDGVNELEPGEPEQNTVDFASRRKWLGERGDAELREFFVETEFGDLYLKMGKQQIVWGKADGLKVLDVVNPQSYREFILEDMEESRIPLWTMNAEFTVSDWDLQFLWIPDKTYNILPEPGAAFEFTSPLFQPAPPPPGVALLIEEPERPSRFWEDSDFGFRGSAFLGGWDLTLNYLYHYNDNPVLFRTIGLEQGIPTVRVEPEYKRTQLLGGTFSNAFDSLTFRGEWGHSNNRYFFVNDLNDEDGVDKSAEFAYVLGFDWQGFENTFLSFQWFQSSLDQHLSTMSREASESDTTVLLRRNFLNETLEAEVLWLQGYHRHDGLMRSKIRYDWSDAWKVWAGTDTFYGDPEGLYGQFDKNDQVRLGLEWSI